MLGRASAVGTRARTKAGALRARIGKRSKVIGRRAGRTGLFPAVVFALGFGLVVAIVSNGFLRWITPTSADAAAPIDITRVSLTIVAGVGGIVALVIAYRRQRDIEQSRFVERFGAAAAQLGASDVAVRIAGVYAMAGAADESDGLRRQQCIDVLCGYLRLPYDPDHGRSGRTKLVTTIPRVDSGQDRGETEEHLEYRQNDREVRQTIVRVIAGHLQPEAEYCWSTSNFDFRTAHFEEAAFDAATFSGRTWFDKATFDGRTWFDKATFDGPTGFDGATFNGGAAFGGVSFHGRTGFSEAIFNDNAEFHTATFDGEAVFYRATFNGHAKFPKATFTEAAGFYRARFNGHARFHSASFNGGTVFHGATFNGHAGFDETTFDEAADFGKAMFNGPAGFGGVAFSGPTTFSNTDFGSERITFDAPQRWGPPAPEFDWDQQVAEKPMNIEPQDWPPAATPAQGR
ncbi:pentapeptide repeat-containing protein [Nocardia sp. NPDC051463]|uniref:pentapeptide repeat-containing protein n=1 Tax=Nocardia sp. NPDC051463 TaxID=3154845 RepID=UPI00343BEA7A